MNTPPTTQGLQTLNQQLDALKAEMKMFNDNVNPEFAGVYGVIFLCYLSIKKQMKFSECFKFSFEHRINAFMQDFMDTFANIQSKNDGFYVQICTNGKNMSTLPPFQISFDEYVRRIFVDEEFFVFFWVLKYISNNFVIKTYKCVYLCRQGSQVRGLLDTLGKSF